MGTDRFQYLILMGLCLLATLPLEFVFGARVWRRPRRLASALAIPKYVTGWKLPFDLPVEELVFFLVIPICSLLTLEAVRRVLGRD